MIKLSMKNKTIKVIMNELSYKTLQPIPTNFNNKLASNIMNRKMLNKISQYINKYKIYKN
jgi:hypothetical protein